MPVLISGSLEEIDLIRLLAQRLREDGGEVRCYLDDDDFELRNIGCKIAVGDLEDGTNLEGALTNVHTFIPIMRDPAKILAEDVPRFEEVAEAAHSAAAASAIVETILSLPAIERSSSALGPVFARIAETFRRDIRPL